MTMTTSLSYGRAARKRRLSIPSFAIFDSSVWCGIPSFRAAPEGPETLPRDSSRAASMTFFSHSAECFSLLQVSRRVGDWITCTIQI
jgi:hypothetical protein